MAEQNEHSERMHETLKCTVRNVLATMCFSEATPMDEAWKRSDTIVTAVNFYGSRAGRFELEASSSAAWSLRDAFVGESSQDQRDEATATQLLGELGTVICGRFLSAVDPLSDVNLVTPQISEPGATICEKGRHQIWQGFLLDGGNLTASIEFDGDGDTQD